jgi:hypothetical protein
MTDSGADSAATRLFALLVRRSRGLTDLVEDLLGRPARARVLARAEITRIEPPGLTRLQTTGPVLQRHVVLEDSLAPHLPVAMIWTLIVPWRLPPAAQDTLRTSGDPLDRVLTGRGLRWSSTPLDQEIVTVADGSQSFAWAPPAAPLVEQTRVVLVDAVLPVAAVVEEIPFLVPRHDPAESLLSVADPAGPAAPTAPAAATGPASPAGPAGPAGPGP